MDVGAVAQLIIKRDAPASSWKGLKIFNLLPNGRPDYNGATLILWKGDSDALMSGVREIPLYIGEPYVKAVAVEAEPVPVKKR